MMSDWSDRQQTFAMPLGVIANDDVKQ